MLYQERQIVALKLLLRTLARSWKVRHLSSWGTAKYSAAKASSIRYWAPDDEGLPSRRHTAAASISKVFLAHSWKHLWKVVGHFGSALNTLSPNWTKCGERCKQHWWRLDGTFKLTPLLPPWTALLAQTILGHKQSETQQYGSLGTASAQAPWCPGAPAGRPRRRAQAKKHLFLQALRYFKLMIRTT